LRARHRHSRPVRALLVFAMAASGLTIGPTVPPTQALPVQEDPTVPLAGEVTVGVDVFKADDGDVVDALNDVHGNVRTQLRALETARSRLAAARDEEAKANQAVAATRKRIDDLTAQSDGVVVDAFMNPPADTTLDAMAAESTGDASLKASIVGMQHDADASILARLHDAHEDLDAHREAQDEAAQRAAATADQAAAALEDVEAAQSQEAAFVLEVESRLDQNLAEAEALASIDPALAAQLKAQEADIAAGLEVIRADRQEQRRAEALRQAQAEAAGRRDAEERAAAQAAAQPGSLGPATGSLSNVACPGGGSITVDSSLASNLSSLLGRRRPPASTCAAAATATRPSRSPSAEPTAGRPTTPLRGAVVRVLAAHGPARHVDAREGPGHRLHLWRRHHQPRPRLLRLARRPRRRLRAPQPTERALALEHRRS
jgi:hypothetical protein